MNDVHHLERLVGSSVVVTGAAGFIGSHLVESLVSAGAHVVGIDNFEPWYSPVRKRENLRAVSRHPRFTLVPADITNPELPELFGDADVVFHLAGRPGVQGSWGSGFAATATGNVVATQAVFEAALVAGVRRVVVASSSSVYGDGATRAGERTVAPVSPYGVSKAAAEQLGAVYAQRGVEVVNLRYFTVYGARQRPDMAFHRLFAASLPGDDVFTRRGTGTQQREFTHVADIVRATMAAAATPGVAGMTFDVGGGASVSLNDVIARITELVGTPPRLLDVERPAGDPAVTVANTEPARRWLQWTPEVGLDAGLEDQLRWHRQLDAVGAHPSAA